MAIYQLGSDAPDIDPNSWIASEAVVIGRVQIGADVSVWPQATLRGDNEPVVIGSGSNVQEGAVLHTDMGCPLTIGANVTIGHLAMLHGCTIDDGALIGIQATVLNNAHIGRDSLVGAGALVTEGKSFPPRSLILGSPAKAVRELSDEEIARMHLNTRGYVEKAQQYREQLKKLA
jgi:carbonic anhydrase/acetyltransferase-like protein (isoleucine patch superfamily)